MRSTLLLGCLLLGGNPLPAQQTTGSLSSEAFALFVDRCVECHGRDQRKGELRLDTPDGVRNGGESGAVAVVAGDAEASDLLRRVSLPPGDEDLMPPAGEGERLVAAEVDLIRRWIESGAALDGWADLPATAAAAGSAPLLVELGEGLRPAPRGALAQLEELGGLVQPLAQGTHLLQVNLRLAGDSVDDEAVRRLYPLRRQITWLDLSGTAVTDAGLEVLARLSKLTRLHLERTAVGDAGLAHLQDLEHLQYLNLYGTRVSDAGLEHLRRLASLRRLYLWQTAVTPEGAARLRSALPEVEINLGMAAVAAAAGRSE